MSLCRKQENWRSAKSARHLSELEATLYFCTANKSYIQITQQSSRCIAKIFLFSLPIKNWRGAKSARHLNELEATLYFCTASKSYIQITQQSSRCIANFLIETLSLSPSIALRKRKCNNKFRASWLVVKYSNSPSMVRNN